MQSQDLFENLTSKQAPLADRMRPRVLQEVAGQAHLLAADKPLAQVLNKGQLHSMIFWGPPGCGKTTLARLMAGMGDFAFEALSAVLAGVKDIRQVVEQARERRRLDDRGTVLFIDEVHRFNKAQQDALLPHVEDGTLVLIGATTENPSFEVNNALLSRSRVYVLKALDETALKQILQAALTDSERGLGGLEIQIADSALALLAQAADGDARRALNLLDLCVQASSGKQIDQQIIESALQHQPRLFDKGGDAFYEQISALHKSVRGSSPDGALYWLCRMLDGGCDPLYIARRVVRMASEDIGNADPRGLQMALNAWEAQERLGSPEGELAIAQAVVYLATSPKSNAVYAAFKAAMADAKAQGSLPVPLHLRNAPTRLMKDLGYGREYRYAHDEADGYAAGERYFPDQMTEKNYYQPVERGWEAKVKAHLAALRARDHEADQ